MVDDNLSQPINIINCARCGGYHERLIFKSMDNPIKDSDGMEWDRWAMCPTSGDPILMRVQQVEESKDWKFSTDQYAQTDKLAAKENEA